MNAISPAVPREYLGLARQFHRDCHAENEIVMDRFDALSVPIFERIKRHPERKLRDGAFRRLADQWEALPNRFRVAFNAKLDVKGRAGKVFEIRVQTAKLSSSRWDEGVTEPALMIVVHWLHIPLRHARVMPTRCIANISLHALARRIQRGKDRSREAIMADFVHLVTADINNAEKFPEGEEFRIKTQDGAWLGETCGVDVDNEKPSLQFVVRTFMDHDA